MKIPEINKIEKKEIEVKLDFNKEKITLLLGIGSVDLSAGTLLNVAESKGLSQKDEFHITIIGRETGEIILNSISSLSPKEKEKILSEIQNLSKSFTWSHIKKEGYYAISKSYPTGDNEKPELRQSIIQLIKLPEVQSFYKKLNELLGIELVVPFPHITLFTSSTEEKTKLRGIGLYSKEQFDSLNPERIRLI